MKQKKVTLKTFLFLLLLGLVYVMYTGSSLKGSQETKPMVSITPSDKESKTSSLLRQQDVPSFLIAQKSKEKRKNKIKKHKEQLASLKETYNSLRQTYWEQKQKRVEEKKHYVEKIDTAKDRSATTYDQKSDLTQELYLIKDEALKSKEKEDEVKADKENFAASVKEAINRENKKLTSLPPYLLEESILQMSKIKQKLDDKAYAEAIIGLFDYKQRIIKEGEMATTGIKTINPPKGSERTHYKKQIPSFRVHSPNLQ